MTTKAKAELLKRGRRERRAHVVADATDGAAGALAGGAVGALAGPAGAIAGAVVGAAAGALLGHHADLELHERLVHDEELDDIDVEEEFFGKARALGVDRHDVLAVTPTEGPLAGLVRDHATILRVLDAFAGFRERMASEEDREVLRSFVTFFKEFFGGWHLGREAIVLDLVSRLRESEPGDSPDASRRDELGGSHREHRLLQTLLTDLAGLSARATSWNVDVPLARAHARSFEDFLRRHVEEENAHLYPILAASLSAEQLEEIDRRFSTFAVTFGVDRTDTLSRQAVQLISDWAPKVAA